MKKFFKHLGVVNKHRFLVFMHCCRCGLFWRGLWHDFSKYRLSEFCESVKYYTDGKKSPLDTSIEINGYSLAWVRHTNRNKHHFEYWYDISFKEPIEMPYKYLIENICDRIAANKCYLGKDYTQDAALNYYINHIDKSIVGKRTNEFVLKVLTDLKDYGEKYVLNKKYLKAKYNEIVLNK